MVLNQAMLITYPDSLGSNLQQLSEILEKYFPGAFGSLHLLPFFPSTGDRGFAPVGYEKVAPEFGDWKDVEKLSRSYMLMFDFMINHISKESAYFQDFLHHHDDSKYAEMFIQVQNFFGSDGPTEEEVAAIYKRKSKPPFQMVHFDDGSNGLVWNTFGEEQIDLNVGSPKVKTYIDKVFGNFAAHGASMVRLDAVAYATKRRGTNDFFVEPEIWELMKSTSKIADDYGLTLLPEVHEHYSFQRKLTAHQYYTYDFALPVLVLYSLYTGDPEPLLAWLSSSPMNQFTTLDTHDGIGIVDAKDLLSDKQLAYTKEELYRVGANVKKVYSTGAYHNLDVYQINSTYYSALGDDDHRYLLARALQIFAPGIPQIYYVGALAGKNDLIRLEKTKEGRDINRHAYTESEVALAVKRPVVRELLKLLRLRNTSLAFELEGHLDVERLSKSAFRLKRSDDAGLHVAVLTADVATNIFSVQVDGQKYFDSSTVSF